MCLAAAQHIIDEKRYAELDIPAYAIEAIEWAWNNEPPALYGRFDLSWAGAQSGTLQSSSSTTPTPPPRSSKPPSSSGTGSKTCRTRSSPHKPDQFNSIHEKLIAKWKDIDPYLSKPIYFAALDNPEDQLTVTYLRDTAQQANLDTRQLFMHEIGWNDAQQTFVDLDDHPIFSIFKLYPWEAMLQEEFGPHAIDTYQRRPLDRAHLEDAPLQQRHPPHPLAALPQPRAAPRSPLRTIKAPTACATTSANP